jgi:hypothetical protein
LRITIAEPSALDMSGSLVETHKRLRWHPPKGCAGRWRDEVRLLPPAPGTAGRSRFTEVNLWPPVVPKGNYTTSPVGGAMPPMGSPWGCPSARPGHDRRPASRDSRRPTSLRTNSPIAYAASFESQGATFTLVTLHVIWAAMRRSVCPRSARYRAGWPTEATAATSLARTS